MIDRTRVFHVCAYPLPPASQLSNPKSPPPLTPHTYICTHSDTQIWERIHTGNAYIRSFDARMYAILCYFPDFLCLIVYVVIKFLTNSTQIYILNDALRIYYVNMDKYVSIVITRMSGRGQKTRPNGTMTQLNDGGLPW